MTTLLNLGPASAEMLAEVGIHTAEELRAVGAVAAFHRVVMHRQGRASLNLLYAMEGALSGVRWDRLPAAPKARLKAAANTPPI